MFKTLFSLVIVNSLILVNSQMIYNCKTATGEYGFCQPIKTCSNVINALKRFSLKTIPKSLVQYLQGSHCGYRNEQHHICCTSSPSNLNPPYEEVILKDTETTILKHPNFYLLPKFENCKTLITKPFVSNGNATSPGDYPWMALLLYRSQKGIEFKCGGSLISPRYVLTAAHCIVGTHSKLIGVRLGEHYLKVDAELTISSCPPPVQDIGIEEIHTHPQYNKPPFGNDIAIIRLQKDADINDYVSPICLPVTSDLQAQTKTVKQIIVSGWGYTETGKLSNTLQQAYIDIVEKDHVKKS